MAVITSIVAKKRDKNRFLIYIDNQFACILNDFSIFKYKLKEGKEITENELSNIQLECEQDIAFDLAIKYLSKYTKTEKEVKDYLISKGYLPSVVKEVTQKIKNYGYINDEGLAKTYTSMSKNKYGKNKIKFMLKSKGISEENIDKALSELESQEDAVYELAIKHLKNKEKNKENLQKTSKFLYGRGFSWEDISKTLSKISKEWEDESW